jgi:AcrR family transcriptional regulator
MGRPRTRSNEQLLDAARAVFLEHGVFGSTKEIARRAGVSEAALFKRFSTKAQLFIAAMAPPVPGIERIVSDARKRASPQQALHVLADGVLDYFRVAIPMVIPLVSHPSFTAADVQRNFDTNAANQLAHAIARYLREQHAAKRLTVKDPLAAAGILVAALHSIALFELMGFHGGAMPKKGVHALVDALWHGLKNEQPPAARARKKP